MKTVTLGEIMLRLSPPGDERLFQSPALRVFFGGAEANVAVSLAHFGLDSHYVTRLPANPAGDAALRALRAEGVRTGHVKRGGRRLGIYFVEPGTGPRPIAVTYDRAGSAASRMKPDDFDWPAIFDGAAWFHLTGITPALGPAARATAEAALQAAKAAGATVSFDVNYRRQLWTPEEARAALRPLMAGVDVLIANRAGLDNGLGVALPRAADADVVGTALSKLAGELDLTHVVVSLRHERSASEHDWGAVAFERASGEVHDGRRHRVDVVDRVGAGDALAAGLIYGLLRKRPLAEALDFATVAGVLKHSIPGDFNRVTAEEVERRMASERSER